MRIAVNTRLLLSGRMEGIGWFAYETLRRMSQQHPTHEFYFLFDRPYDKDFVFGPNVKALSAGPPSRHPVLWYLWFERIIPRLLRRIRPDVFFSPEGYLSLGANCPMHCVMHDIAYEHYPETVPALVSRFYKYYFPRYAQRAARIGTVSGFSKEDIVRYYSIPESKIDVVYNGCNEQYHVLGEAEKEATRQKWTGGKPYFMFIGGLYPRKNIKNLILAFNYFRERSGQDVKLLLIGRKAYKAGELEQLCASLPHGKDVQFLGRVDDIAEVNRIISASLAMTYVSVFEGFGIPCLEAMRCGTAVIASDTSSLPEVCGKAALYIDPFSIDSIAEAMLEIAENPRLRETLLWEGEHQQSKFSWQLTSELLWQSINRAAGNTPDNLYSR